MKSKESHQSHVKVDAKLAEETVKENHPENSESSKFVFDINHSNLVLRRLGERALKALESGLPIPDEIIAHIITEKIKTLNNDRGWILDGFPLTYNQAKLLEKFLTGYDSDKPNEESTKKVSKLLSESTAKEPKPKHKSGIDLIVYLDLSDDIIIKRSLGRMSKRT